MYKQVASKGLGFHEYLSPQELAPVYAPFLIRVIRDQQAWGCRRARGCVSEMQRFKQLGRLSDKQDKTNGRRREKEQPRDQPIHHRKWLTKGLPSIQVLRTYPKPSIK